jgi:hypothetical protein
VVRKNDVNNPPILVRLSGANLGEMDLLEAYFQGGPKPGTIEDSKQVLNLGAFNPLMIVLTSPCEGTNVYTCIRIDHNKFPPWQSNRSCPPFFVSCE